MRPALLTALLLVPLLAPISFADHSEDHLLFEPPPGAGTGCPENPGPGYEPTPECAEPVPCDEDPRCNPPRDCENDWESCRIDEGEIRCPEGMHKEGDECVVTESCHAKRMYGGPCKPRQCDPQDIGSDFGELHDCIPPPGPGNSCSIRRWMDENGAFDCDTYYPPPPECSEVGGTYNESRNKCEDYYNRPNIAVFADNRCQPQYQRIKVTWTTIHQVQDLFGRPNETYTVYFNGNPVYDGGFNSRSHSEEVSAPIGSTFSMRVVYRDDQETSSSFTHYIDLPGCEDPFLFDITRTPQPCPQGLVTKWWIRGSDPRRIDDFQGLHIQKYSHEDGEHTGPFFISKDHDDADWDSASGVFTWTDFKVKSFQEYGYAASADYGNHGTTDSPTTSPESWMKGETYICESVEVTSIDTRHGTMTNTSNDASQIDPKVTVQFRWEASNENMDGWLKGLAIYRRMMWPDRGIEDHIYPFNDNNASDENGHIIAVLQPGASDLYTYTDRQLAPGVSYFYRMAVLTYTDNNQYSQLAETHVQGAPWPAERLHVDIESYVHQQPNDPPPGDFPWDLPDHRGNGEYGRAIIQWTNPLESSDTSVTHYRLRYQWKGTEYTECTFTASQASLVQPITFPHDIPNLPCTTEGILPQAHYGDTRNHEVRVWAKTDRGWGVPAVISDMKSWTTSDPGPADIELQDGQKANVNPLEERLYSLVRGDWVKEYSYTTTNRLVHDDWIQDFRDPSGWAYWASQVINHPSFDVEEPVSVDGRGVPCQSDFMLKWYLTKIYDANTLGSPVNLRANYDRMDYVDVQAHAIVTHIDTRLPPDWNLSEAPDASVYSGERFRPYWTKYWNETLADAHTFVRWDEPRRVIDEQSQYYYSYQAMFNDYLTEVQPQPLSFNGLGPLCIIEGLLWTGRTTLDEHPRVATISEMSPSTFHFTHTRTDTELAEDVLYDVGEKRQGYGGLMVYQVMSRVEEHHDLVQQFTQDYVRHVELTAQGTKVPLTGIWSSFQDTEAQDARGSILGKIYNSLIDTVTPWHLDRLTAANRFVAPLEGRIDVRDTPLPLNLDEDQHTSGQNFLEAWLELRPDKAVQTPANYFDADAPMLVSGQFLPVAYVGGIREWVDRELDARELRISYQWEYHLGRLNEDRTWTDITGNPEHHRPPFITYDLQDYEDGGGYVSWRVTATLEVVKDGEVLEEAVLVDEKEFMLDKWSLDDAVPWEVGLPVIKEDIGIHATINNKAWWYTFPEERAPWEDEPKNYTRGIAFALNEGNLDWTDVDPSSFGSAETPQNQPEGFDLEAYRARDTFLQFVFDLPPDLYTDDAVLVSQILRVEDMHSSFQHLSPENPESSFHTLTNDGTAYEVQPGDTLSYLMRITPLRGPGVVEDGGKWNPALWPKTYFRVVPVYDDTTDLDLVQAARSTLPTPGSIKEWNYRDDNLRNGKLLTGFALVGLPNWPNDMKSHESAFAIYVDQIRLERDNGDFDLYTATSRDRIHPYLHPASINIGDGFYVAKRTSVNPASPTGTPPDPASPFLTIREDSQVPLHYGPVNRQQSLLVGGLYVGQPLGESEDHMLADPFLVPDNREQVNAWIDDAAWPLTRPQSWNYLYQYRVADNLAFEHELSPRRLPNGLVEDEPHAVGLSDNDAGILQVWPSYSYRLLLQPPDVVENLPDHTTPLIADSRTLLNLDGSRTGYTSVETLPRQLNVAAAPATPFEPPVPSLLNQENAALIDLNAFDEVTLEAVQEAVEDRVEDETRWIHIDAIDTTMIACFRFDTMHDWAPARLLDDFTEEHLIEDARIEWWFQLVYGQSLDPNVTLHEVHGCLDDQRHLARNHTIDLPVSNVRVIYETSNGPRVMDFDVDPNAKNTYFLEYNTDKFLQTWMIYDEVEFTAKGSHLRIDTRPLAYEPALGSTTLISTLIFAGSLGVGLMVLFYLGRRGFGR